MARERELAPDENLRWENWDSTIKYVKKLLSNAAVFTGSAKKQALRDAKNALAGVPDAHPEKSRLVREVERME